MVPYTKDEILTWLRACTSVDTIRQVHQTASARSQDLAAGRENPEAKHMQMPHVLVGK